MEKKTPPIDNDRDDKESEYVTHADCQERHGNTKGLLVFLSAFFLLNLGAVGTAVMSASNSNERVGKVEARQDALEREVVSRLDTILGYLQKK